MWRLRLLRWYWSRKVEVDANLRACWEEPLASRSLPLEAVDFLVCDAEMSGLDARCDDLLSIGWVRLSGGEIILGSAEHHLIRNRTSVGQSAVIHQLRDCDLTSAAGLDRAFEAFLRAARGCVLVFHHAPLDLAFLNRASESLYQAPILMPVVDTLHLEQRLIQRRERTPVAGELRLQACRERYALGGHDAHNALTDALATAELLLAHASRWGRDLRLGDLL